MGNIAAEDEVSTVILALLRDIVEAMVPCASNNVVRDDHLRVGLRECEAALPSEVFDHHWDLAFVFDYLEEPVVVKSDTRRVLHPDTVLSKVGHDVVLEHDVR